MKKVVRTALDYIAIAFAGALTALLIIKFVAVLAYVPSGSMLDTIQIDSRLLINKMEYNFKEPERGDIVVFNAPDDTPNDKYLVKRIIALPNETIQSKDGEIYINGELLHENYIKDNIIDDFGPYTLDDNSYFVMGDNRLNSFDARYWNKKYIDRSDIVGRAVLVITPKLKVIRHINYE